MADILMLTTMAAVGGIGVTAVVRLAQRHGRTGRRLMIVAAGIAAAYGLALVAVGLVSRPVDLAPGDVKCFDDWCVTMLAVHPGAASTSLVADLEIENRGRGRAMRSDLARAYLDLGGREIAPVDGAPLRALVDAGSSVRVDLTFPVPAGNHGRLVVVEDGGRGIGPGTFELGGELSPYHARAGWTV